jgi:hypothetical protein
VASPIGMTRSLSRRMLCDVLTPADFNNSISADNPPPGLSIPLTALWYDAKGEWARAHQLVDELETRDGMAVHAYLHRKNGDISNSEYWYDRCGREYRRDPFEAEREALVEALLK